MRLWGKGEPEFQRVGRRAHPAELVGFLDKVLVGRTTTGVRQGLNNRSHVEFHACDRKDFDQGCPNFSRSCGRNPAHRKAEDNPARCVVGFKKIPLQMHRSRLPQRADIRQVAQWRAQRSLWKILREFWDLRCIGGSKQLVARLERPSIFVCQNGVPQPEAPHMGVVKIALAGFRLDPPDAQALEAAGFDFERTPANKVMHGGGIRRGFVGSCVEWIFRFQQKEIKCRGLDFAMGVKGSEGGQ